MSNEKFTQALRELGVLYSKTKKYVLRMEEVDPESRSNLAIFKEQRDALDHVMRALTEFFDKGSEADEDYLCQQVDNARGHMFRAAYDALDGAGVSYKLRISAAMEGISNEAIAAVYPDYHKHVLVDVNKIEERIAEHRKLKDERRTKMHDLDDYCVTIDRLYEHSNNIIERIPSFQDWQRRHRRKVIFWSVITPALLIFLSVTLFTLRDHIFPPRTQNGPTPSETVTPSPSPTMSPSAPR